MDPYLALAAAAVGVLVGLTGAGGGALVTPMLVLLFSVKPSAAIASDLVAALVMRPVGAAVHLRRGTVNLELVGWLAAGSVPSAFAGAIVMHLVSATASGEADLELLLGGALLAGAGAMLVRQVIGQRSSGGEPSAPRQLSARPLPTVAIGVLGGFMVGATSVGAGSLMIVLLLFVYPTAAAGSLVGTDLAQALPLTAAAALGAALFGHVELPVTAALVAGSVPGVLLGSLVSSRVPDRYLRPAITLVILASGLKYVGLPRFALELAVTGAALLVGLARLLPDRRRPAGAAHPPPGGPLSEPARCTPSGSPSAPDGAPPQPQLPLAR